MKETRESNYLSNTYLEAYLGGKDTFRLGDSFIA
jgi:hypothetical protein